MIKMTPIIPIFLDSEPTISGEGNFYFLEYLEFKLFRFNLNAYIQLDHENEEIPHQFQERSEKIQEICGLLEHLYPKLYVHVSRQLKITLRTELIICDIFRCFCRTLFKTGIRWPRIMALFAFASGLVLDCIREGRPEFSRTVVYCMKAFIEDNLAGWVKDQGGWEKITDHFHHASQVNKWCDVRSSFSGIMWSFLLGIQTRVENFGIMLKGSR